MVSPGFLTGGKGREGPVSRTGRCDISRFWAVVATVCLLFCFAPIPAQAAGSGTVVIEALTGRVLYEENAQARLPMASTTKIMTALLTLEQRGWTNPFRWTVNRFWWRAPPWA